MANETVGDVLKGWSHKFKSSELKAVQQFVGDISNTFMLDRADPKNKSKALCEIGRYVKRLEMKSRRVFKNIGGNETDCYRAKVPLSSRQETDDYATGSQARGSSLGDKTWPLGEYTR